MANMVIAICLPFILGQLYIICTGLSRLELMAEELLAARKRVLR